MRLRFGWRAAVDSSTCLRGRSRGALCLREWEAERKAGPEAVTNASCSGRFNTQCQRDSILDEVHQQVVTVALTSDDPMPIRCDVAIDVDVVLGVRYWKAHDHVPLVRQVSSPVSEEFPH